MKLFRQIRALFRREKLDAEVAEELRAHLEMQEAENRAKGMTPEEARYAARRQFGGVDQVKESAREARGLRSLEAVLQDFRFALRTLRKAPGLTAVVVLSLALGIGANTTIFSWLNGVIFGPLPGVSAELLSVEGRNAAGSVTGVSRPEYQDLVERLPAFAQLAAQRARTFSLGDDGEGRPIWGELVSGNFFATLGVRPALGRFFGPDEAAAPGREPVVVVSHDFWLRRLGGRPEAVGQTIRLNRRTLTVIGVAPAGFAGGWTSLAFELWVPLTLATELTPASNELTSRDNRAYLLFGTLRPGVSLAQARSELASAARSLAGERPSTNAGVRFEAMPLWRNPRAGAVVAGVVTLQLFAALVLAVVCVNTANLLLARASVRRREIGIRLACGAGAARLLRQLLTESLLLGLAGAALGAVLAGWGVAALRQVALPTNLPVHLSLALDWRGAAFATLVGVGCGVLFGLAPALQLIRGDVQQALRGGRGSVGGHSRLRDGLVAAEIAAALVVLVLAGLFAKSFRHAQTLDAGYDADRVLLASVDLIGHGYARPAMRSFLREAQANLAQLPGVQAVAAANLLPLDARGIGKAAIAVDGAPLAEGVGDQVIAFAATDGYFATMGMPFVAGRDFARPDESRLLPEAVINEELARRFWPGLSAQDRSGASLLGHRVRIDGTDHEVVGVVRNAKYENLAERPQPAVWLSARDVMFGNPVFHLRLAAGDPLRLLPAVRDAIHRVDPGLAVYDGRTLARHVDDSLFLQRVPAQMLGLLSPLVLGLAAIGVYAVLAYSLAQRTREIGIRLTLGATPGSVVRLVLREGLRVGLAGAAAGWLVAFALGWFFRARLVGVPLVDLEIHAGVPALLLAVVALACWVPARRAAKVDPMVALRAE